MKPSIIALGLASFCLSHTFTQQDSTQETLLLRSPTLSESHGAIAYAGDSWVAGKDGSNPRRNTGNQGAENSPKFSPDGQRSFSGN